MDDGSRKHIGYFVYLAAEIWQVLTNSRQFPQVFQILVNSYKFMQIFANLFESSFVGVSDSKRIFSIF